MEPKRDVQERVSLSRYLRIHIKLVAIKIRRIILGMEISALGVKRIILKIKIAITNAQLRKAKEGERRARQRVKDLQIILMKMKNNVPFTPEEKKTARKVIGWKRRNLLKQLDQL